MKSKILSYFKCVFFSLTLKLWYDQLFKARFGADSVNAMRRVVNLMQDFFFWPSLNTTIVLTVLATEELPISLTAYADGVSL